MTDATHSPRDARVSARGRLVAVPGRPRDASLPNNLPLQLSSFVGHEKELAEVKRLLKDARLLTLTGPGGCGKTRLALAAADELVEGFEDGAWLVELAPLSDPSLVPQAVASALGVREQPNRSLTETLSDNLRTRKLLLDNCEYLIEACATLVEALLRSSPELRVLATSREALGIVGEVAWPIPPLSLPRRAQRQRGRCLAPGSHRADRRRGRKEALHQPAHRELAPGLYLPQVGIPLARGGYPLRRRARPPLTGRYFFRRLTLRLPAPGTSAFVLAERPIVERERTRSSRRLMRSLLLRGHVGRAGLAAVPTPGTGDLERGGPVRPAPEAQEIVAQTLAAGRSAWRLGLSMDLPREPRQTRSEIRA